MSEDLRHQVWDILLPVRNPRKVKHFKSVSDPRRVKFCHDQFLKAHSVSMYWIGPHSHTKGNTKHSRWRLDRGIKPHARDFRPATSAKLAEKTSRVVSPRNIPWISTISKSSKFPESVLAVLQKPKRQALVMRLRPISSAQKGKEMCPCLQQSTTSKDANLKAEIRVVYSCSDSRHLVDLPFFSEAVYSDDAEPSQNQLLTKAIKSVPLFTSPLTSRGIIAQLLDDGQKDPGRTLVSNHVDISGNTRSKRMNVAEPKKHDRSASSQHPGTKRPEMTKTLKNKNCPKVGLMRGHKTVPVAYAGQPSRCSQPHRCQGPWKSMPRFNVCERRFVWRKLTRSWGTKRIKSQDWLPTSFCTWRHVKDKDYLTTITTEWPLSPCTCLLLSSGPYKCQPW